MGNSEWHSALRTAHSALLTPHSALLTPHSAGATGWKWWFLCRSANDADDEPVGAGDAAGRRTPKMARLEAVLLVSDAALSTRRLAQLATLADVSEVRRLIELLNTNYDRDGSAFRIERVATGYQMMTRPEFSFWLNKVHQRQAELKLSPPAMETLTIVAYRQPITRADVEAIRGVQCAEMLKQLMERGLVRIGGQEDTLGRPYLYETTRHFLEIFGLHNLDDLPMVDRLRQAKPKKDENDESAAQGEEADENETSPPTSEAA